MGRLADKTALVTGGASGIGKATVELMLAEGARVLLTDIEREAGEGLVATLGERAAFQPQDVGSEADWERVLEYADRELGGLDILVNNAGIAAIGDIEHTSLEDWQRIMQVNATGCFLGCKHGLRHMKQRGGSIINISSVAAMVGMAPYAAYTASKGAVRSLTKSVAAYCRDQAPSLRCNSVHPGAIRTPMTSSISAEGGEEIEDAIVAAMGEPEDVAHMIVFLASDEARFLNGTEQVVDRAVCSG